MVLDWNIHGQNAAGLAVQNKKGRRHPLELSRQKVIGDII